MITGMAEPVPYVDGFPAWLAGNSGGGDKVAIFGLADGGSGGEVIGDSLSCNFGAKFEVFFEINSGGGGLELELVDFVI